MGSGTVYLLIGISVAVLAIANVILISAEKASSISFGGTSRLSVFDGNLTLITSSNGVIWIHGSDNKRSATISFSNLVDESSGEQISDITASPHVINDITNNTMKKATVSFNNTLRSSVAGPGVYQGSLFITSGTNKTSIPFTLDLKPNLWYVIILVVDGIAISILAWKFIIYHNHKAINSRLVNKKQELQRRKQIQNPTLKDIYMDIMGELKVIPRDIDISFQHLLKNPYTYSTQPLNLKKYVENAAIPEKITSETVQIIGTVFFGVGVSVLGLLNNSYLISLHDIGPQEALVLIGIGLGIGSLKDFPQLLSERKAA